MYMAWFEVVFAEGRLPYTDLSRKLWPEGSQRALNAGAVLYGDDQRYPQLFAAFSAWTGDLKEKTEQHRFERNYQCNFLCERCLGVRHKLYLSACPIFQHVS